MGAVVFPDPTRRKRGRVPTSERVPLGRSFCFRSLPEMDLMHVVTLSVVEIQGRKQTSVRLYQDTASYAVGIRA